MKWTRSAASADGKPRVQFLQRLVPRHIRDEYNLADGSSLKAKVTLGQYSHTATCRMTSGGEIRFPTKVGKRLSELARRRPGAGITFEVFPQQTDGSESRDFLVLWRWPEALRVRGRFITDAYGTHSEGPNRGDRMFVWATHDNELYLLGAILVTRSGADWAEGSSLYGLFKLIPLRGHKWRLRFQGTDADRLSVNAPLALQVRSRRRPSPESVVLLERLLSSAAAAERSLLNEIAIREGQLKKVTLSKRERNRNLRVSVLASRGDLCEICGFNFAERYGEFARGCVEIYHLQLISLSGARGGTTALEDVIVVCPNCHRALHQFGKPGNWRAFQRQCKLAPR